MKVLRNNGEIVEVNFEEQEGKEAFWHTSAHVLAQAVKRLYPETKCAIGPAIENGFYYDFDFSFAFSEEHLQAIEEEMRKIVKKSLSLQVFEKSKEEALRFMEEAGEKYKVELIEKLGTSEKITFYKQGEYEEFCAGPHLSNVCQIKAIKLLSVAGAYWRGNEKNPMLTRIYGISFPKASQLEEYLHMLEEAKARDHRKLGKELGIFTIFDEGPGLPVFLPKGMVLKNLLIDYWRKIHRRDGYVEISTPIMLHRVVFGSIERFIGILIEHYAGKFPVWIAPVQVKILPVSDKYNDYAKKVADLLDENNIRVELDCRSEKLGYKIRQARMDKVPYMVIVGENEQNNASVSVRQRDAEIDKQDLGEMKPEQLIEMVQ